MSKIEQLIQQHCPDGVEYKEIGSVLNRSKGTKITAAQMKEINTEKGKVKIFAGGKTFAMVNFDDIPSKDINYDPSIIVKSRGIIEFEYYDKPFSHKNEFWSYQSKNQNILIKYVYYFLKLNECYFQQLASKMQMPQIALPDTEKYKIPIPPLPIQQEIVTILDKFTALEAELEAELEARSRQYDYYRNQLLAFEDRDVEWKTLGDVGEFVRGKRFVRTDMIEEGFPCIHYGEMYTHYNIYAEKSKSFISSDLAKKLRVAKYGDVIIVAAGETIEDLGKGTAWLGKEDVVIHDACFTYTSDLNPKYVSYFLRTKLFHNQIKRHISSGKISAINAKGLAQARIPVPSNEEQERIVNILDQFDALVNDIKTGLPAEIKARRAQYEYYRKKLLTFNRVTV